MENWQGVKLALAGPLTATNQAPTKQEQINVIDKEAQLIDQLVVSAKNGNWSKVWNILGSPENPRSERIINAIPENRRWGILHQAIYWNNTDVLMYLLRYQACDSETKAKQCTSECGETTRMTAAEIAKGYGYKRMSTILSRHTNKINDQDVPTFELFENYTENEGLGLISVTLAAYKNAFHPSPIDPNKSVITILSEIYQDIVRSDERRVKVQSMVSDSIYVVCPDHSKKVAGSSGREDFFKNIIDTYTQEENYMYTYLNVAFRRQRAQNYRPTGDDLALGPFAVMYQILLLYWPELPGESRTTYRRMLLTQKDADKYQVGTKLVWQSVVSSSIRRESATPFPTCGPSGDQAVIFTIDNRANSAWRPRNIEKYARYMEHERTYPAGGKFLVTGRTKKGRDIEISLRLL